MIGRIAWRRAMTRTHVDHDHQNAKDSRINRYGRLDRIRAGEGGHPSIRMLDRRRRKGETDATRVKQYLRIERGFLA